MLLLRPFQTAPDLVDLVRRCSGTLLGLLLERVKNVDNFSKPDGVDRPIGVAVVVLDDFQDAGSSESLQRFRAVMLSAPLGNIKRVPNLANNIVREAEKIFLGAANPS